MSTVHERVAQVLGAVLPNTWANELCPNPTWPAAVFAVESEPEASWCAMGGYVQHDVNLVVMAATVEELDALLPAAGGGPMRAALEALDCWQFEEESGDADYEPDPKIFARYLTVRLRTRRIN